MSILLVTKSSLSVFIRNTEHLRQIRQATHESCVVNSWLIHVIALKFFCKSTVGQLLPKTVAINADLS